MPAAEDFYALLRIAPSADATAIRDAYRALMRRYHPDVNASDDAAAQAKAINAAYACLRDPDRRAAYDWQRGASASGARATQAHRRPQRPRPVWTGPTACPEPPTQWFRPTWRNAVGLGIAAVITAITFTITSTIPPVAPAVAKPVVEVRMRVAPRAAARSGQLRCKRVDAARPNSTACSS
jgi:hypothetical protein